MWSAFVLADSAGLTGPGLPTEVSEAVMQALVKVSHEPISLEDAAAALALAHRIGAAVAEAAGLGVPARGGPVDDDDETNAVTPLVRMLRRIFATQAPQVIAGAYRILAEWAPEPHRAHLAGVAPCWQRFRVAPVRAYSREVLGEGALLYRSAVSAPRRPGLMCFTSIKKNFFMDNARFLLMLGGWPIDVVVLSTPEGTFADWRFGAERSFAASLAAVQRLVEARDVTIKGYFGASTGGPAAVHAAVLDGQRRARVQGLRPRAPRPAGAGQVLSALSLGARFIVPGRDVSLRDAGTGYEPLCACQPMPPVQLHNVFSGGDRFDTWCDARLRVLAPQTQSWPLARAFNHNVVAMLTARAMLKPLIDKVADLAYGRPVEFGFVAGG